MKRNYRSYGVPSDAYFHAQNRKIEAAQAASPSPAPAPYAVPAGPVVKNSELRAVALVRPSSK